MFRKLCGFLVIAGMLTACGGNNDFIPPPPPIAPPVGGFNGGGFGGFTGGGNCGGSFGSFPLNQTGQPYYGSMVSQAGSSSISLQVGILNQPNFSSPIQQVAGSAQIDLADLRNTSGQTQGISSFCVSSQSLTGGSVIPGNFAVQDQSIAITMEGYVQVPLFSPYGGSGGLGGTFQYGQDRVVVSIGTGIIGCNAAFLRNGRLVGCLEVQIGNGQRGYYQLQ